MHEAHFLKENMRMPLSDNQKDIATGVTTTVIGGAMGTGIGAIAGAITHRPREWAQVGGEIGSVVGGAVFILPRIAMPNISDIYRACASFGGC
jgi:hypothetical protein